MKIRSSLDKGKLLYSVAQSYKMVGPYRIDFTDIFDKYDNTTVLITALIMTALMVEKVED